MVSDGNCYVEFTNPGEVTFNQSCFVFVILLVYVLDELKKSPPKSFHESSFMKKAAALLLTFGVVCVYLGAFLGLIKVLKYFILSKLCKNDLRYWSHVGLMVHLWRIPFLHGILLVSRMTKVI